MLEERLFFLVKPLVLLEERPFFLVEPLVLLEERLFFLVKPLVQLAQRLFLLVKPLVLLAQRLFRSAKRLFSLAERLLLLDERGAFPSELLPSRSDRLWPVGAMRSRLPPTLSAFLIGKGLSSSDGRGRISDGRRHAGCSPAVNGCHFSSPLTPAHERRMQSGA